MISFIPLTIGVVGVFNERGTVYYDFKNTTLANEAVAAKDDTSMMFTIDGYASGIALSWDNTCDFISSLFSDDNSEFDEVVREIAYKLSLVLF
jgi:hypothetical protein